MPDARSISVDYLTPGLQAAKRTKTLNENKSHFQDGGRRADFRSSLANSKVFK